MARLLEMYKNEVFPKLQKEFGLTNPMQVPRITKITCNIGIGEASRNAKLFSPTSPGSVRWCGARASRSPRSSCGKACRSAPR